VPTLLEVLDGKPPTNSEPIRVTFPIENKFYYSGGGFTIVEQLLIDTYKQPFPDILNELVLKPLQMTDSRFQQPISTSFKNNIAIPYRANYKPLEGGPHTYPEHAAAGLWTTPSDLAKFVISIQKSLHDDTGQILTKKYAELFAVIPQSKLKGKKSTEMVEFGLGLIVKINKYAKSAKNGTYFAHSGQNEGYRNFMIGDNKTGNGLIIMTNMSYPENQKDNGWKFIMEIEKKIADMNQWK
jgi:CubicO group peptidase (beta-lactamase class C family)